MVSPNDMDIDTNYWIVSGGSGDKDNDREVKDREKKKDIDGNNDKEIGITMGLEIILSIGFNQRHISPSDAQNVELLQCTFVRTLEPSLMPFKELPYTFVGDGVANCEDGRDESMCSRELYYKCQGKRVCAAFMPIRGPEEVCIKHDQMCDKVQNCPDNSDEEFCADCLEALTGDGVCLPSRWFQTKSEFDTFKRYPKIVLPNLDFTNCNDNECFFQNDTGKPLTLCSEGSTETINSKGIHKHKYAAKCHYFLDRRNATLGCVDNSHLTNCTDFKCGPGFYKCKNSYCIPNAMRMNGMVNCPSEGGYQDEEDHEIHFYCLRDPNRFYSAGNLCDGRCDCGTGCDDEMLCHEKCPSGFMCLWGVTKLIDRNKVNYTNLYDTLDKNIKLFRASGLDLSLAYVPRYIRLDKILELHLSNCSLDDKKMTEILLAMSDSLQKIYHIDLSYNKISFANFYDFLGFFESLKILNLSHTSVSRLVIHSLVTSLLQTIDLSCTPLESFKFLNPRSSPILYLNVSSTIVKTLDWFDAAYLPTSVGTLDMRNTNIVFDLKTSEHLQNIKIDNNIYGDSYKLCCEKFKGSEIPSYACNAPSDAISSCENLLNDDVKRSLIWLVALIGCSGNAVVIGYRFFYEKQLLKQGYRMFVTNLGLSDFIMSVYLIIIAGADVYYRDDYVLYDIEWRDSSLCKAAGFLATLSTETSSLFVLLITFDRYVIFKNTLNTVHFTPKILIIVVALIWATGIAISTIPILFPDWQVYSSNTMCLALPVNLTHPLGWIFSLLIYIVFNCIMMLMISLGQILIFKQIAMPSNSLINTSSHRRREITVAKNLSLIAVSNVLCWMPVCVIGLLSAAGYIFSPGVYGWLAVAIMPLNSAVNPILYTLPVAYNALNQSRKPASQSSEKNRSLKISIPNPSQE
ncbi:G-protein coupled receptor GRL101-like [Physella acuta]|uniref:G-protein coupled receptor GRL101-like n=1 Tax=Physella acuta TaxID=109671 RepID=UPI0027DE7FDB|nr:G-protein coupled receptor GRL101-like [Physella acuta]